MSNINPLAKVVSVSSGSISTEDIQYLTNIEVVNSGTTYIGKSNPGSSEGSALWQIKRILTSGGTTTIAYADGDANFDNTWDSRGTLTYS